ncbi:MAG TPA: hypothetical protein VHT24_18135, partial [Pseudacidobacterium sp.]|nr:hypothetical protein [Pseudacidobacterium sp.]
IRLSLLPAEPVPTPVIHDEFSYLLAADTFVHGRLTNPQPPVPAAFETFHVNIWPTYQSMYLPGTGLALALGQLLGSPWVAVLLTAALFCAMVFWAVSGWLPRRYGLTVALLAMAICFNWNIWFDNYFCLGLTGIAGALVIGSIPRILNRRTLLSAIPLGMGLAIFLLTRPYEGCIVSLPAVLVLLWNLRRAGWKRITALAAGPALLLCLTFGWLSYYNWRGTGHPLLFPYTVNYEQYHITGPFMFSPIRPFPVYHHESMGKFYAKWELGTYRLAHQYPYAFFRGKLKTYYHFFLAGNALLLLLGAAVLAKKKGLHLAPVFALLGFLVELILMAWRPYPQYGAPAAALFFLLIAFGLFAIRRMNFRWFSGVNLARGWVLAQILLALNTFYVHWMKSSVPPEPHYASVERQKVEKLLLSHPGKQLCLVKYSVDHPGVQEWVYNGADLKNERIVWARSMDPENDHKLMAAFPDRSVWLLEPDDPARNLMAYSPDKAHPDPNRITLARAALSPLF